MPAIPVIAIYDIGRTHKKFLLFDRSYKVVFESSSKFEDITDDDGLPCEDLMAIHQWLKKVLEEALRDPEYDIRAINFSAHGASLVHLDAAGFPVTPLYDYMRALDGAFSREFYQLFGGKAAFSVQTGSPVLDMLNSGIQLYWLKKTKPGMFAKVSTSLHLPQYGNHLFSGKTHADITSIGCHTGLWDFKQKDYHRWVQEQRVADRLPVPEPVNTVDLVDFNGKTLPVGIGLHDSSAALLPFVYTAKEPFLLLSSGTWNITLHPFFEGHLSDDDYTRDCLYYLLDVNRTVAASRLFLGNEYQHQVKRLETYYEKQPGYYLSVAPDVSLFARVLEMQSSETTFFPQTMSGTGPFPGLQGAMPDLSKFKDFETAYHKLMLDITYLQKVSVELLSRKSPVSRLYVSGGFVQSEVFMELLQAFLPGWQIFIAENKRASALGAALAIHDSWQQDAIPESVTSLVPCQPHLNIDVSGYHSYFESSSLSY